MQVVRITEPNPRLAFEVRELFEAEGTPAPGFEEAACYVIFDSSGTVEGAAFVSSADDVSFLRGIVVREASRKKGLGSGLVSHILSQYSRTHEALYLVAVSGRDFFERFGFREIPREKLPKAFAEAAWRGAPADEGAPFMKIDLLRGRACLEGEGRRHDT